MESIRSEESFYLPKFSVEEKQDLRTYFTFYERYRNDISDWAEEELSTHEKWGEIIRNMPMEERLKQREINYQTQAKAIYQEDWMPYLKQLNYYGIFYARIDMDFHSWFELVGLVRRFLKPHLKQLNDMDEIVRVMNGMDLYMDVVMSNIGEAYIAEKESIIEKQKLRQELLAKELETFVYIVSHDLQEPLNTIKSFLGILEEEYSQCFVGEPAEILSYMKGSTYRMKDLVSGLLDHSRLSGNKDIKLVALDELLADVLSDLTARINQSHATVEILGNMPTIKASPNALKMLFQNLIGNAIKFHQAGIPPVVKISAEKEGDLGWHFVVADNGIGIVEQDKEKAFLIFKRLNASNDYEGTGIGLAHCKKIVESHGGQIWIESAVGKGSEFHFTLFDQEFLEEMN